MKDLEKKIRLQLYDPEFNQVSDRLLAQDTELRYGPKEVHKGPMRVEVSLFSQEDIELFRQYLDKLIGALPIESKRKRGRKKKMVQDDNYKEIIIDDLQEITDSSSFYSFLEEEGFVFSNYQLLKDLELPVNLPEDLTDPDEFRIALRLLKKAKNPLNHKYDPTLLLVIPRKGDPVVQGFSMTEKVVEVKLDSLKVAKINIPKSGLTKFPAYMTMDERNKFRVERDKLDKDPEMKPSKFYSRWAHPVADSNKGNGVKIPRIDEIEKPY